MHFTEGLPKRQGEILIKKKKDTYSVTPGSRLSFDIQTNPVLRKQRQIKNRDIYNVLYYSRREILIDPFEHENLSLEIELIIKEIQDFASHNYFNVNIFLNGQEILDNCNRDRLKFKYFNKEHNLHFDISTEKKDDYFRTKLYYKNQEIDSRFINLDYININANILKSNAKEIVTLNRNYLLPSFEKNDFMEILLDCIFKIIPSYFNNNELKDLQKQYLSMFINYYWDDKYNKFLKKEDYQQWKDYEIMVDKNMIKIDDIFSKVKSIKIIEKNIYGDCIRDKYEMESNTFIIRDGGNYNETTIFIYFIIQDLFPKIQEEYIEGYNERIFIRSKSESDLFEENRIISYIKGSDIFNEDGEFTGPGREGRYIIPCGKEYLKLQIKNEDLLNFVNTQYISTSISNEYPKMISPYLLKIKKDNYPKKTYVEKKLTTLLYDWVYQNRFDETVSKDDIIETYNEFVKYFDEKVFNNKKNEA